MQKCKAFCCLKIILKFFYCLYRTVLLALITLYNIIIAKTLLFVFTKKCFHCYFNIRVLINNKNYE